MAEIVVLIEESSEGGYVARGMGASIVTEADDLPQLREALRDAVRCHFEPDIRPKLIHLHLIRDEVIAV